MRFGPFRINSEGGVRAAFRQLASGLHALSTENFSKRGVKETVLNLEVATYEPTLDGSFLGSHDATYVAKYIVLHHLVFVDVKVEFTTSGVADDMFTLTLPFIAVDEPQTTQLQTMPLAIVDTGGVEAGIGYITKNTNQMECERYDSANWGTGSGRAIIATGWYLRAL